MNLNVPDLSRDVLAALRAATHEQHSILDVNMPLAQDVPTLNDYHRHLRLLKTWMVPLIERMAAFDDGPQNTATLMPVNRLILIDADLADDTVAPAVAVSNADPADTDAGQQARATLGGSQAPHDERAAYRWGIYYVIEGSQLGGAVLYKRLSTSLAPHPLRYLHGDGPPGPRWLQFIAALRANVLTESEVADACEGARHAFDGLLDLLRASERKEN
jgi:heme oxygenase